LPHWLVNVDLLGQSIVVEGKDLHLSVHLGIAAYPTMVKMQNHCSRTPRRAQTGQSSWRALLVLLPEFQRADGEKIELENMLRTALDLEQFILYYQPKSI